MIQLEMQWLIFLIVIYFLVTYIAYSQNYKNLKIKRFSWVLGSILKNTLWIYFVNE